MSTSDIQGICVSFGILAWNEASTIESMIRSVLRQSLFTAPGPTIKRIHLAVMANGSTDGTPDIARRVIAECEGECAPHVTCGVHELSVPSRAFAWNAFVHELSDPSDTFLGLMDADIVLTSPHTLRNLVDCLHENPQALAAGAKSIKDLALRRFKGPWARASLLASRVSHEARQPSLAGQLYLGRAPFWRRLYVPYGLCADDALFTHLARTNLLTEPPDFSRVVECETAPYVFEAYVRPRDVLRQHRRRSIGGVMRQSIINLVKETASPGEDAGDVLTAQYRRNPTWLVELLHQQVQEQGLSLFRWKPTRLYQLRHQSISRAVLLFPAACVFTAWSMAARLAAYRTLKYGEPLSVWKKARSQVPQ